MRTYTDIHVINQRDQSTAGRYISTSKSFGLSSVAKMVVQTCSLGPTPWQNTLMITDDCIPVFLITLW